MPDNETRTVEIDVISDVMCPWCYIGKKNLEAAARALEGVELRINWRPFQLDPTLPPEGKDRARYLEEKFGGSEKATAIYERVNQAGHAAGIDFAFDAISVSPNTLDAHRLIRWAGGIDEQTQQKVVDRLFELYFLEGGSIGDTRLLSAIAEDAGMDGAVVRELLATDRDREAVQQEIATAQKMGVTGVPCFILDRRLAVMGAQPPEILVQAIRQAANEPAPAAGNVANDNTGNGMSN
ncbi:MAG: DsbA family oxidoreductase [Pseudomonadota bacterium]|nr:DsbA family oxidoreductase [Pseudomonadota bacterium]